MKKESRHNHPPRLAIIGRPNVGKSTLFNRLAGGRKALVDDEPGVTRDRNYANLEWLGQVWRVVDTGGLEPETDDDVLQAMRGQSELAIREADAVIFLLDGLEGLVPADREVVQLLRRAKKTVFYAVNKIDGPRHEPKLADFFALGVDELFPVSATHGYGVDDLLDAIKAKLPGTPAAEVEDEERGRSRIAVIGRPNVGKSTLINALLGEARHLVHDRPGTTRDAVDSLVMIGKEQYLFIDTAGLRRKSKIDTRVERFSSLRSLSSLERCHLCLLMMDAGAGVVDQDAKIASLAHDRGRALILLFNKWDLIPDKEKRRAELEDEVKTKLPHVSYAPVLTLSAQEGTRVAKIGEILIAVLKQYNLRVGTGELNRGLMEWVSAHHPPFAGRSPIRFYYATQIGVRPPDFVIFANRPDQVPASYERYLMNRLRENFGFEGSPIRLHFRARKQRHS